VKRAALTALIAVVVAGALLALSATDERDDEGRSYEIVFDNAFALTEGGDFRVAGVRAGTTPELEILEGPRPHALVKVDVTEPGLGDLRRDATCEIRPQSFIGEYFVDCQPGKSPERLPDGGRVPVEQTTSTVPLDLVNNIARRPYAERLRIIVGELGAGLAGRPEDLSAALRRAHPGLRETNQTLRVLARQTKSIRRLVTDSDEVVAALARRREDVSRFVSEAGATAAVAASRRGELAQTFNRLPVLLGELDPYMLRLGQVATAQQPVLRDLRGSAGDLDRFLTLLPRFADNGRPAFAALGESATVGRRAVRKTRQELDELRRLAEELPGLAKPLRQTLQTLDDRKRAVEDDPRAAATDPPAGDKTHIASGPGGFTGMEAIWNYFYWQALSTNSLDEIGHILRLSVSVNECSEFFSVREGEEEVFDRCSQWVGPYQPGINAPDPTEGATPEAPAEASQAQESADTAVDPARTGAEPPAPVIDADPVLDYLLGP
jgi:virulence factor Mce-like protein